MLLWVEAISHHIPIPVILQSNTVEDTMYLIRHVKSQDRVIEGSCNFMRWNIMYLIYHVYP